LRRPSNLHGGHISDRELRLLRVVRAKFGGLPDWYVPTRAFGQRSARSDREVVSDAARAGSKLVGLRVACRRYTSTFPGRRSTPCPSRPPRDHRQPVQRRGEGGFVTSRVIHRQLPVHLDGSWTAISPSSLCPVSSSRPDRLAASSRGRLRRRPGCPRRVAGISRRRSARRPAPRPAGGRRPAGSRGCSATVRGRVRRRRGWRRQAASGWRRRPGWPASASWFERLFSDNVRAGS